MSQAHRECDAEQCRKADLADALSEVRKCAQAENASEHASTFTEVLDPVFQDASVF